MASAARPACPARQVRRRLDHSCRPRVGQVRQAELDGVGPGAFGQLVQERLDREHVEERTEGTQRGRPDRHGQQPVPYYLQVGDAVAGHRVARGAHGAGRRAVGGGRHRPTPGQVSQGQQPRLAAAPGAADEAVAPHVLPPGHDPALGVQARGQPRQHGGTERRPGHLVLSRPQHPDRPPRHGPGEQRRVQRGVVGAVVPVGAGALGVAHGHPASVQAEPGRDGVAQREHALAVAPHGDRAVIPAGDRAARRHRGVREERPGVLGGADRGRGNSRALVAAGFDRGVLGGRGQQEARQVIGVRQRLGDLPPGRLRHQARGAERGGVSGRDDTEERAVADRADIGRERGIAGAEQFRHDGGRPDHAAIQHPGQDDVVQEPGPPGDLVRQVEPGCAAASHRPPARRLDRDQDASLPVEQSRAGQRPVAEPGGLPGGEDLPIGNGQRGGGGAELGRGGGQHQRARLRARLPQRRAGMLDGQAARGDPLVRAAAGAHRGHRDPGQRDVEFFRGDLGQRRPYALAVLHLSGEDRDLSGGGERQPGGEDRVGGQARDRGKAGLGHWVACRPECCEAALSTAATILPCVPHRQRLPFSASRTSCSVGAGLAASSAAAVTIIPEVQ